VLDRHKKSETYKQVSDCLSSEGSVNRSLSDLHCPDVGGFLFVFDFSFTNELAPPLSKKKEVKTKQRVDLHK
uniref:hypothetical protein n=1 Tax=Vibrio vulnificus TaxID=672 RepID=UPI000D4594AE